MRLFLKIWAEAYFIGQWSQIILVWIQFELTSQSWDKDKPKTSQRWAKGWANWNDKALKESDNQLLPTLSNCGFFLLSALSLQRRSIFIGLWTFVATFCLHTSNKDPTRIEFTISFFTPTSRMKFKQEPFLLQNSGNFEYGNRIPGSFCHRWNLTIRLRLHQPSPFLLLLFLQKLWKEGAFCLEYRFLMQFQFLPDP